MKALVRHPSPCLNDGLVTHIERSKVDYKLAVEQWHHYVDVLQGFGWSITHAPSIDECPDGVFIEDAIVMYEGTAILTRPGSDTRKPEVASIEPIVAQLGYAIHHIVAPGTLDGGDVLKAANTIYIGQGARTNSEGIKQFRAIVAPLGATVIAVATTKALHLKSAVTALPDGTIIGWLPVVDDASVFAQFMSMPEESGAHVVIIDDNHLLMASDAPQSAEVLRSMGYLVTTVDISEYEKLEGCVTCLSVRMRHVC